MNLDEAWMDPRVWDGVTSLLDHYAAVQASDTVVLAYTGLTKEAAAVLSVASRQRGIDTRLVRMGVLEDATLSGRLAKILPTVADLKGRLILITLERDTLSHGATLSDLLQRYPPERCAIFRAISVCPEFFSKSLLPSPGQLSARNTSILNRGMKAERLRVETPSGSRLQISVDNRRYRWLSNRGAWTPGRFTVLPAGEVALFPAAIEGTFIADAAYNTNLARSEDTRLTHPVAITIQGGRAVSCEGADAEFLDFLASCFDGFENARMVGELGFGTNWGVNSPIALNSHVNERLPGVHVGFGDHNQTEAIAGYACPIHIDLIARGGQIWFDDDPVPVDLEALVPSNAPHPTCFRDDDVRAWDEVIGDELGLPTRT